MTRLVSVAVTIALSVAACGAMYAQPSDGHNYSQSEIKQMIRDAHTAQQYHEIADLLRKPAAVIRSSRRNQRNSSGNGAARM